MPAYSCYAKDHLGSTRATFNTVGQITEATAYTAATYTDDKIDTFHLATKLIGGLGDMHYELQLQKHSYRASARTIKKIEIELRDGGNMDGEPVHVYTADVLAWTTGVGQKRNIVVDATVEEIIEDEGTVLALS